MSTSIRSITYPVCTFAVCIVLIAVSPSTTAQAQTPASCAFHQFSLPSSPQIFVSGVNDSGTAQSLLSLSPLKGERLGRGWRLRWAGSPSAS